MNFIRAHASSLAGMLAFPGCALAPYLLQDLLFPGVLAGLAVAALAGYRQGSSDSFFTGMALAFAVWAVAWFAVAGTAGGGMALLAIPAVFVTTFVLGAAGFFAGRCMRSLRRRFAGDSGAPTGG